MNHGKLCLLNNVDIEKSKMNQTKFQYQSLVWIKGEFFLRCTKILSQCHFFLSFILSPFLACKNTFTDDYEGI